MNLPIDPLFGRPNGHLSGIVQEARRLFKRQQPNDAISLLTEHGIPLSVVQRVILGQGPRRRTPPPAGNGS